MATVEYAKPVNKEMTPREELAHLRDLIQKAKDQEKYNIVYKNDLTDLTWQTLSQEGYKLKREVDPDNPNRNEKINLNKIQFTIKWG